MIVEELFENTILPGLKEYVKEHSIYSPVFDKTEELYPQVSIKLLPIFNQYNNLSYKEETYIFGISVNVYTKENNGISKSSICNKITSTIVDYFKTNFRMTIRIELDIKNENSEIYQNNVKVTGKLDTRYGIDHLVIYPYEDYEE